MNANGNKLDIWLIYRCSICRHTLNLTIYERMNPARVPVNLYEKYLANDSGLAMEYGRNRSFFAGNKAAIVLKECDIQIIVEHHEDGLNQVILKNPHGLTYREDKVLAQIFSMSRSQVKKKLDSGVLQRKEQMEDGILYTIPDEYTEMFP